MATKKVTAHTTAVALFSAPKVKKAKITAIDIDNQSGAARTVRLQDIFTPDDSVRKPKKGSKRQWDQGCPSRPTSPP